MGTKITKKVETIKRKHIYVVTKSGGDSFGDRIVNVYSTYEKAKAYCDAYAKENYRNRYIGFNNQGGQYDWYETDFGDVYIRICAYELDCDYGESNEFYLNPKEELDKDE